MPEQKISNFQTRKSFPHPSFLTRPFPHPTISSSFVFLPVRFLINLFPHPSVSSPHHFLIIRVLTRLFPHPSISSPVRFFIPPFPHRPFAHRLFPHHFLTVRFLIISSPLFAHRPFPHHFLTVRFLIISSLSVSSSFPHRPFPHHFLTVRFLIISSPSVSSSFPHRPFPHHFLTARLLARLPDEPSIRAAELQRARHDGRQRAVLVRLLREGGQRPAPHRARLLRQEADPRQDGGGGGAWHAPRRHQPAGRPQGLHVWPRQPGRATNAVCRRCLEGIVWSLYSIQVSIQGWLVGGFEQG